MKVHSSGGFADHWWLRVFILSCALSSAATQFWDHPTLTKKAIKSAQKVMLNALGLTELPRPGLNVIPHDYMLDLYKRLASGEHADRGIKAVHAFTDQEQREGSSLISNHQTYVFNVNTLPLTKSDLTADVRILRQTTGRKSGYYIEKHGTDYLVSIYSKPANYTSSVLSPAWKELDSFSFDIREPVDKWIVLSVNRDVQKRRDAGRQHNAAQFIVCVRSRKTGVLIPPQEVGFSREGRARNERALLVVFLTDAGERNPKEKISNAIQKNYNLPTEEKALRENAMPRERRRRDSGGAADKGSTSRRTRANRGSRTRRKRPNRKCRRKPLHVDFSELGWSTWVIAPDGYDAYYCEGSCDFPLADHYKPTNHAVVQTIVNSVNPKLAPKVCCIPNRLSSVSILYVDSSGELVYKKYDDMVVERCGCS